MDAIALLCTLHADGPATVRRLREAGCADLAALLALAPEDLARLLAAAPAVARRFQREARHLQERLGTSWDDRGDVPAPAAPVASVGTGVSRDEEAALRGREPHILATVLAAWRRKDEECHPEAEPGRTWEPPSELAGDRLEHATGGSTVLAACVREAGPAGAELLRPGLIDGLDETACAELARAGVVGVAELARCDALALAARTRLGFTRVNRWRSLAARVQGSVPAQTTPGGIAFVDAPQNGRVFATETALGAGRPSVATPAVSTLDQLALDAAGPFA